MTVANDSEADIDASNPVWPRPVFAWYITALMVLAYAFAIVDRIAIGLMVDDIKADLHVSDTQIGLLQGFAFAILYTAAAIPVGYAVDRRNRRNLLALGISVWSVMTILSGFTRSFHMLFAARIGVGLGEATVTPAASSLISDLFPPARRARAFGVFMVGGALGAGFAYALGAVAIQASSTMRALFPTIFGGMANWHITFILLGAPGVLLALMLMLTAREPMRRERATGTGKFDFRIAVTQFLRHPLAYASLMVGATMNIAIIYAQFGWVPSAFNRLYGWSPARVGATLSVLTVPAGALSALAAGWIMAWFVRRGRTDGPILVAAMQGGVFATLGSIKFLMPTAELALTLHVLTSLTGSMAVTAAITGIAQITPNEARGQLTAVYTLLTGLVSVTAGSFIVGFLNDHVFTGPRAIGWSLSTVYIAFGLGGLVILLVGRRAFQRASLAASAWNHVA